MISGEIKLFYFCLVYQQKSLEIPKIVPMKFKKDIMYHDFPSAYVIGLGYVFISW